MNVLLLNPYRKAGGAEVRQQLLLREFQKHSAIDEVHFLFIGEPAHKQEGKIHYWSTTRGMVAKVVKKLIEKFNVEIVQQHNFQEMGTKGVVIAKKLGVPTIYVAHDYRALCPQHFMIDVFRAMDVEPCYKIEWDKCKRCVGWYNTWTTMKYRKELELCDVGIAASKRMIEIFEMNNFLKGKWEVITPWVDIETFYPEPGVTKRMQCCVINNFIPHKGAWVAVKAWKIVSKRLPQARLYLQGDARWMPQLSHMIRYLRLENVTLLQRMETRDLRLLYSRSWFTVVPSIWEATFELVRAESLCCGTPVIASRIGSIPETSKYGHVLFEPRNYEELADCMIDLFLDQEKAEKLAREGMQWARKEFDPKRAADDFVNLYTRLLG